MSVYLNQLQLKLFWFFLMNHSTLYSQYKNHDFVLYQNHEAQVIKTIKNNTIKNMYPIQEFISRRVTNIEYSSQLQVLIYIKLINLIQSIYFIAYLENILFINMIIIILMMIYR